MAHPDAVNSQGVACPDAAPQRGVRGPHPLADFLAVVAQATGADRAQLAAVLAGVRAYQAHAYVRTLAEPPEVARVGGVRLLDYGGSGPPAVFVPSLINPPTVLDLAENNSLLRWLRSVGIRPLLVDWGEPGVDERRLDIDGYVAQRLLPLLAYVGKTSLIGYCLGGTMALSAARSSLVQRLALIATPWRFGGYSRERRRAVAEYWHAIAPMAAALGVVPMEMVQPMFWRLDPAGVAAKYAAFGRAPTDSFVALEDWANTGPPLSLPAARQLFVGWYDSAAMPPEPKLAIPIINFVATGDRIVPQAVAPRLGTRVTVAAGHVGMLIGSRGRAALWEPLRAFLGA